jgi:hypothetical protein
MDHRGTMTRILAVGGLLVLLSDLAAAQSPIFRRSRTYALPGSVDQTFYTNVVLVADIGSPAGAGTPDGIPDLITANSDSQAPVLLGNGDGTFTQGQNAQLKTIPTAILLGDFDGDKVLDLIASDTAHVEFLPGHNDGSFGAPVFHCTVTYCSVTSNHPCLTPVDCPKGETCGPSAVTNDQQCRTVADCPTGQTCGPFPAGRGPSALAAQDLDHDDNLDLIVVDDGGQFGLGAVTILLGNGNGTFKTPGRTFTTGAGSDAVALGRFNSDTEIDLAVANEGSNDVTILRGTGGGGFTIVQTIPVGQAPVGIAAEDLNGDHVLDLVVVNSSSDSVAVLDGKADGTFKAPRFFPSGSSGSAPNGLVLADMNLDGHIDVVTPNTFSNDASVLLGDGKGNFAAPRSFVGDVQPVAVAAPDLNGDQIPDVVTINGGSQVPDAAVLLGQGDGSLSGVENVATEPNPSHVIAGYIDNDGVSDLIVTQSGSNSGMIMIYPAEPPTGFALPTVLQSAGDTLTIGSGDFNGDGLLDLVVLNSKQANVSLFLGQPGGRFAAPHAFPVGPNATALVVGDWNGDTHSDVAVTRQTGSADGAVDILLSSADGSLGTAKPVAVATNPVAIASGDFNKDGKRDLVVGNGSGFSVLLGKGDGTFQAGTNVPVSAPGADVLAIADFDRDGADDVAVARQTMPAPMTPPNVQVFYGDGKGGFAPIPQTVSVNGVPSALVARDFTGDGIPDLLATDQVNGVAQAIVSSASRTLTRSDTVTISRGPVSVAAADFDGDGRYDGAVANSFVAGSVSVLTNILAPAVVRGDGNGDGKVTAADAVAVMRELGDGNGSRVEQVQVAGGAYPAAAGIDANGDGFVTGQDALAVAHRLFPRL